VSSGSQPDNLQTIFVDRSIGRRKVPGALRALGATVIAHDEIFPDDTSDEAWLSEAGRKGWIVITRDDRIRYRPNEKEMMIESGALVFVLTGGNLTGSRCAEILEAALQEILTIARTQARPAIYRITSEGKISHVRI